MCLMQRNSDLLMLVSTGKVWTTSLLNYLIDVVKMVTNVYKEERDCRENLNKILDKIIKGKLEKMSYMELVKQSLISFAVSRSMVEQWIKDFYIETGDLKIDEYNNLVKVR